MLLTTLSILLLAFLEESAGFRAAVGGSFRQCRVVCMMSSTAGFSSSKVLSNRKEAEGLRVVEVEVNDEAAAAYKTPGQYVQIKKDGSKPGFYAIASPPDQRNVLTFLIKDTESNAFITATKEGDAVEVSSPQGKGFQIEEYFEKYKFDFPTNNVYLMACGSGLAPIAAAIESKQLGLKTQGFNSLFTRQATLYLGVKTPQHLPFASKFKDWEDSGVSIIPVLSKPPEGWTGRTGYIQDALAADGVKVPRNSGALLCGPRGMTDNVKEILLGAGVFEGRILLNF